MASTGTFSFGQSDKSTPDTIYKKTLNSTENVQNKKLSTNYNEKDIDTQYQYVDSTGMKLIIKNSIPKGRNYTSPDGKGYASAIFWTQIINETAYPFELTIDFTLNPYKLPSSLGNYFKILLFTDTVILDKECLFNYGLPLFLLKLDRF